MRNTYFETENQTNYYSNDCSLIETFYKHAQHSEALAQQLLCLESLDVRATAIVHNLDNNCRGIEAILLAPAVYASAELPPPGKD